MSFYMYQGSYTSAAAAAMIKRPNNREAAARQLIEAAGGKLHSLFFCFGDYDFVALVEAPDDVTMAACALAVGASGATSAGKTTKLVTPADGITAMEKAETALSAYNPPGA